MFVDLVFPVMGRSVPADHAYLLYSAVSSLIPDWHGYRGGMGTMKGQLDGTGLIELTRDAAVTFRIDVQDIAMLLPLAGKSLALGEHAVRLGVPRVHALEPVASLRARVVTIKGFMEPAPFAEACRRQLAAMGVEGSLVIGERRVLRVKDKRVVGFTVHVEGLGPAASLALMEKGIGGRRKMGCGVFSPARDH